jgi:hypothetical protein
MTETFQTDWLASQPVFYNELTEKVSLNINDVIDFNNFEFHPEGFNNYLDFGYSILEQTPIKHVKFLRHSSVLTVNDDGNLKVEYMDDPVDQWIGKMSHEDEVLHILHSSVRKWEESTKGNIILPTSGGYDSRLLGSLIEDKSRVNSFTYGLSENQAESYEVIYAKKVSEVLGIKWQQIILGAYHNYFEDWERLFGPSTHAHGMYHIEFYEKILSKMKGDNHLLSGIVGDIWAGNLEIPEINSISEIKLLGYTHGLNADSRMSKLLCDHSLLETYCERQKEKWTIPLFRIVEAMRHKIILLSYLLKIPKHFGFKPWSPFLDRNIALHMLTLPAKRRKNRLWQKEYFQKKGLDIESMGLIVSYQNNLNHQAMRRIPVKLLNVDLLSEVIKPDYIKWINLNVSQQGILWDCIWNFAQLPLVGGVLRRLNINEKRLQAYNSYLTLKPIETLLRKKNNFRSECG